MSSQQPPSISTNSTQNSTQSSNSSHFSISLSLISPPPTPPTPVTAHLTSNSFYLTPPSVPSVPSITSPPSPFSQPILKSIPLSSVQSVRGTRGGFSVIYTSGITSETATFSVDRREQLNLVLFEFQRSLGKLLERLLRERETGKMTPVKQSSVVSQSLQNEGDWSSFSKRSPARSIDFNHDPSTSPTFKPSTSPQISPNLGFHVSDLQLHYTPLTHGHGRHRRGSKSGSASIPKPPSPSTSPLSTKDSPSSLRGSYGNGSVSPSADQIFDLSLDDADFKSVTQYQTGCSSKQGVRSSQEDTFITSQLPVQGGRGGWILGVFDGHCGSECSSWISENIVPIWSTLKVNDFEASLNELFKIMDEQFCTISKEMGYESGATACVAIVTEEKMIYVGNVGDCRCIKSSDVTTNDMMELEIVEEMVGYEEMSIVHKANDEIEKSRILKCNGWVQSESEISIPPMARLDLEDEEVCLILERNARERLGTSSSNPGKLVEIHRVCGELSVSRALGDIDFKSAYNDKDPEGWWQGPNFLPYDRSHSQKFTGDLVTSEPGIVTGRLNPRDWVLICCDGVTDVMELEDLSRICDNINNLGWTCDMVCDRIVELAIMLGSSDNCTAVCLYVKP
ncbi:hypothetical protein TrST_g1221 [Triparma strigata]|uniref:protein-serine/threonine phosphatase n=1 Tax=Triparma strigata TaxID=1606541 RepID=A0A9W7E1P4_9STRA|nr:hypothetical protein TrST_g1221 [Triparma strigata]